MKGAPLRIQKVEPMRDRRPATYARWPTWLEVQWARVASFARFLSLLPHYWRMYNFARDRAQWERDIAARRRQTIAEMAAARRGVR